MRGAGSSGARANLHFSVSNLARHGFFFAVAAGRRENGSDARVAKLPKQREEA